MAEDINIRDPLYGYISVSDLEQQVIDTEPMQRLRRIHQLGMSSIVYPGATHTRFAHSLGAMHIAGKFAESLDLDESRVTELRIAGLLHDTGHGPFSHASELFIDEDDTLTGVPHEEISCAVVDDLGDDLPANPERVKEHIRGQSEFNIIAGTVDADRLDYLQRDSYMTGVEHGTIDAETIIQNAEVRDGELVFSDTALQALEGFLTARVHMIRSVYTHHTSVISEMMLQRALGHYVRERDLTVLQRSDDYTMHTKLMNSDGPEDYLYSRLVNRDLFKRACILDEQDVSREELREFEAKISPHKVERQIANEAGVHHREVLVDPPSIPTSGPMEIPILQGDEVNSLSDISPVPSSINELEWRSVKMAVYAPEEHRETVGDVAEDILYGTLDEG